jgi:tetratricopeptide (TPR) repeat protein
MPKRRTQDAVHVLMTDHRIQRRPLPDPTRTLPERTATSNGPLFVYYPELPAKDRDLYLGAALISGGANLSDGVALLERATDGQAPAQAFAVLGEGYLKQGNIEAAIRVFRNAVNAAPDLPKGHYNFAQALETAGHLAEAQAQYETALRLQSPFPEAEYAFGNLLLKSGNATGAMGHYQNAIRARPVYPEAHHNLGNLYVRQGHWEEARAEFEAALALNPAFAEAHNNLARVLASQNDLEGALVHARRAVSLKPDYVTGRYNLGQLLLAGAAADTRRFKEAIVEFQQVLRLDPAHTGARKALDMAVHATGSR